MDMLVSTDVESILTKCPICKQTTTFLEFECVKEDEDKTQQLVYYRCLKCLKLFQQVIEEVVEK